MGRREGENLGAAQIYSGYVNSPMGAMLGKTGKVRNFLVFLSNMLEDPFIQEIKQIVRHFSFLAYAPDHDLQLCQ